MVSLGEFARRIRLRGRQSEEGINRIVREVALVADREVVMQTPVDTGRARSNWLLSLGGPSGAEIAAYAEGKKGSTSGANSRAAMEQAKTAVAARQPEQDIYISNNLPYIGLLNDGSSAQAPAGFVQAAVKRAASAVRLRRVFRNGD
jgi:hypothetical protein